MSQRFHWQRRSGALAALALLMGIAACGAPSSARSAHTPSPRVASATPGPTATPSPLPARYVATVLTHGFGSPDDLAVDGQGRLLFADFGNDGVNVVGPDGQISVLLHGLLEPEGIVALPDGSLLIAVQGQRGQGIDEILRLPPGSARPSVWARFSAPSATEGLDGISVDPRSGDILAADSPHGMIYRIRHDGTQLTRIAGGFVRPTDAVADRQGTVYVADEWGNRVVRITPDGAISTLAQVGYPDDLAFDLDGTLLVTSLTNNNLIRLSTSTGSVLATLATNLHQPQGLAVDNVGNIYVSEQQVNVLLEMRRIGG